MFASLAAIMTVMSHPAPDTARLKATVEHLASYTTRNTLSEGHKEAAKWVAEEFKKIEGVEVELMEYALPKGRRVPEPVPALQVVATLPGKTDRVILVGAHLDSLNLSVDAKTGRAPGANDDASGVALCMELARMLADEEHECTFKFVAFTGEEQGLLGATALAKRAKEEGWKLEAMLNNDTVGSSSNLSGQKDTKQVRVFSEEGEGHNSRELARFIEWTVRHSLEDFRIKLVLRRDRFGRGGDHTPFVREKFSGVRFIEVHEEYAHQHTPDDLPENMDWDYLANVVRANYVSMKALGNSAPAPTGVRIVRDQSHSTTLRWKADTKATYTVYWRDTGSSVWQKSKEVFGEGEATIELVNKDDHIFAVGSKGGIPQEAR